MLLFSLLFLSYQSNLTICQYWRQQLTPAERSCIVLAMKNMQKLFNKIRYTVEVNVFHLFIYSTLVFKEYTVDPGAWKSAGDRKCPRPIKGILTEPTCNVLFYDWSSSDRGVSCLQEAEKIG